MDRMWVTRLRWRMRGAWLWPCFLALTLIDALLLRRLPISGDGPGNLVAALLLAGFANLFLVAVLAPLAGRVVRRRRGDLPRMIADNYAGTALVLAGAAALLIAGLVHRPVVRAQREAEAVAIVSVREYVSRLRAPEYHAGLASVDLMRVGEDMYRSCVPGPDPRRWLCVFVNTGQRPAGVTRDPDRAPNVAYQIYGGHR